ncbi:unnamed protein product [Peniophora sp. CBMAI 1063]|nr:unnamed protein product [Peniophora sp. CBMAI 1063]
MPDGYSRVFSERTHHSLSTPSLPDLLGGSEDDPHHLATTAYNLLQQYNYGKNIDDLRNSIMLFRRTIQLSSESPPDQLRWLDTVGDCLLRLFKRSGSALDLDDSINAYQRAAHLSQQDSALPKRLGNLALSLRTRFDRSHNPADLDEALNAHRRAVDLPLVVAAAFQGD